VGVVGSSLGRDPHKMLASAPQEDQKGTGSPPCLSAEPLRMLGTCRGNEDDSLEGFAALAWERDAQVLTRSLIRISLPREDDGEGCDAGGC